MARINIEDKWWSDPRRNRLIDKLGNSKLVDGLMVQLWRYSQNHNGEPFEWKGILEENEAQALACVGLCLLAENGTIYVKGSSEAHEWLNKRRESGRKGGQNGTGERKNRYLAQAKRKQTQASSSSSSSSSISYSNSSSNNCEIKNSAPEKSDVSIVGKVFRESYKSSYGKEYPGWGAKENGQIKQWLKSISFEQAQRLAKAYPYWNDPFISKRGHPLGLLITNYVGLSTHIEKPNAIFEKISAGKNFESAQMDMAKGGSLSTDDLRNMKELEA